MKTRRVRRRRGERGVTLAIVMMVSASMLMLMTGGLMQSATEHRITQNYQSTTQGLYAAESGVIDAVAAINDPGVANVEDEVVDSWGNLFGSGSRQFATSDFSYSVVPVTTAWDAADPTNRVTLRSVASGPRQASAAVVARLERSGVANAPGAIYIANPDTADIQFNGNAFTIDGNDMNYTGGPGPGAAVPGVGTSNLTNRFGTLAALNEQQNDNVTGLGFNPGPPALPSVQTAAAPDINQLADALLQEPHVTCTEKNIKANTGCTFGTADSPQITYMNDSSANTGVTIQGNGNVAGYGILIVEGSLEIAGTLDFTGLVLVRGNTTDKKTKLSGNATIFGSLWTNDLVVTVSGSMISQYSSEALELANQLGNATLVKAPVTVASMADCSMLAPGTNGCP